LDQLDAISARAPTPAPLYFTNFFLLLANANAPAPTPNRAMETGSGVTVGDVTLKVATLPPKAVSSPGFKIAIFLKKM